MPHYSLIYYYLFRLDSVESLNDFYQKKIDTYTKFTFFKEFKRESEWILQFFLILSTLF